MVQKGVQLDQDSFVCSICLDLLKEPVTIPCGHSYCMNCINGFWDEEEQKEIHSCPQCRTTFAPRPLLVKSTMLAALMEQLMKTGFQAAPAEHCYAGLEHVGCDFCAGRKLKAVKSCLVCLASYCEEHLQPHYDSATFRTHKLVEPSENLLENVCSLHNEVTKMFCRTDLTCICFVCSVGEHKGHDLVSAAAEWADRQKELEMIQDKILQNILEKEKGLDLLQREVENINRSADKTLVDSEVIFTELVHLVQKKHTDVKQQIRSQQQTGLSRVKEVQKKLEQEIAELKREAAELKQLSNMEDPNQFLRHYPSASALSWSSQSTSVNIRPLRYFETVTAAVFQLRDNLQAVLTDNCTKILQMVTDINVLQSQPESKSRADFFKYSCEITLDPKTAHSKLLLSQGNRKVSFANHQQFFCFNPDRFTEWNQVMSRESLTGRCYWEVECGRMVYIAVTYRSIRRAGGGNDCGFGRNDKSWALYYFQNGYKFFYNNISTFISSSGPISSRVGVFLDHSAGTLSFYSVSDTLTLLHRVQTTFTQPLYAGFQICGSGTTAQICELF